MVNFHTDVWDLMSVEVLPLNLLLCFENVPFNLSLSYCLTPELNERLLEYCLCCIVP